MSSRDYTKSIGNRSASPHVPLPLALGVLTIVGAGLWFGVAQIRSKPSARHMAEEAPAVAGKPVAQAHGTQR
jgi:hypothetical protein